jgi:membrane-associated protease RseP (regulator of RpoE activity)
MNIRAIGLGATLTFACLIPLVRADEQRKVPPNQSSRTYQVPYKLTDTEHVLVRAKINGKGPFNFIIDTGAPLLYVSTAVGKKLGLSPDAKGWTYLDRFEIEGGVVDTKVRSRVETPFQLEGMNSMGLAGAELHGIIGYTVLAQYRLEFDFTKDKMRWTRLEFTPPAPQPIRGKGGAAGIEAMAGLMKVVSFLLGSRGFPELTPRGFLGLQLTELEGAVTIGGVLPGGPAEQAGIKAGDRVSRVNGTAVTEVDEVKRLAAKVKTGQALRFTVVRGLDRREIVIQAGEGL